MEAYYELIEKLLTACRILDHEGIIDELGHFSVRIPDTDHVLINGKISPGQACEKDIVLLDLDGNRLKGELEPAKEIPLHLAVYQRCPKVVAVVHTHSPNIVALSAAGIELRAMENLGATAFGEKAPIFEEPGLVDTFAMGYRIVDTMAGSNLAVLKGHGDLVTGESIEETCISALWAEKAAALQSQAMMLGKPDWFSKEVAHKVRDQVIAGKAYQRAWNYFSWRIGKK